MTTENSLIDSALRGWKSNVERADKLFEALSPGQLEQEVAPGKNRLIYLWGHLAAVNDGLLPLLGIGERLHPEFDGMFISNPDRSVQLTVSGQSLKAAWQEINQKLWEGFSKFSASDWAQRHTAMSEEDFEREPHRNRFTILLGRTAHLAYHVGQATLARPKAFQKSNLAIELKAGKKRLEVALHGLSDEQCERAGATRPGSVVDLLSEIVSKEFLALMEVSDRLPSLPMNLPANADGRTPPASRAGKDAANKSVQDLLAEFGVLRSAVIRRIEGRKPQGAKFDAKQTYVADVCVTRINELIDEIERWRSSEIVGFSAARVRAEAREAELNQAIVELSREDFLAGNFDLKSLFSLLFDRFYSEDFVLWLGTGETSGRTAAFQRMADVLEPINTLHEMGLASIVLFRPTEREQDTVGNLITEWETVLGGTYSTGMPVRWRTVRAWKSHAVIAERIEDLPSPKP